MTLDQAGAFFLFAFVAAITPGPSNVLLTATGAQAGFWRGLPCAFGVSAGMGSLMFLAALGLGSVLIGLPDVMTAIRFGGAAFLLWLAWKIATAPVGSGQAAGKPTGFLGAAALQWVNPKAWMVATGAVATYLQAGSGAAVVQALLFALVFVSAAFPSNLIWLGFGATAQRLLADARRGRIFNIVMGVTLAASVLFILR
ncbi:MAG: LysE family translocator [Alphaproteobacteria bacterium]|nr:LysE family translocator [Alphaproteobacteria bacterium]